MTASHRAPADAAALAADLRAIGIVCDVEGRDALALLVDVAIDGPTMTGEVRTRIVAAARQRGFTHVAAELRHPTSRCDSSLP